MRVRYVPRAVGEGSVLDSRSSKVRHPFRSGWKLARMWAYAGHSKVTCASSSGVCIVHDVHSLFEASIFNHPSVSILSMCDLVRIKEMALLAKWGIGTRMWAWASIRLVL